MAFDLELAAEFASELGLSILERSESELRLDLGAGAVLLAANLEDGDDLVGFAGTPWHGHGVLTLAAGQGRYIELDLLDVLRDLASGELLICELWQAPNVIDRWVEHHSNASTVDLELDEELRVRRAAVRVEP